ncbi:MAG: hypothetical protein KJO38_08805 [Gammaproteobacteria bacterium]|nr:hypothetical protein [Gammaproteobacteria bacterium]
MTHPIRSTSVAAAESGAHAAAKRPLPGGWRAVVTIAALACVVLVHWGVLDTISLDSVDRGFKRTLITYGLARGLNGVISVAQGTELAVEPAGVGVTFAPGQILDPINDLVERFAGVVLFSGASLGIQKLLLAMAAWPAFSIATSIATLLAVALLWMPAVTPTLRSLVYRLACLSLALRLAVPVAGLATEILYAGFMQPLYESAMTDLRSASTVLTELNEQAEADAGIKPDEEQGFFENARQRLAAAGRMVDVRKRIDAISATAEQIGESAINLIAIFVLQTLLLPLLFAWLFIRLLKWLALDLRFS